MRGLELLNCPFFLQQARLRAVKYVDEGAICRFDNACDVYGGRYNRD
jgi:hypothetical protein